MASSDRVIAPLLALYSESTPPVDRTGGRLVNELTAIDFVYSVGAVPFHYNGRTFYITADKISGGWDDLRFPATAINPPGIASDPDFDTTNGGWLFDGTSQELLFVIGQLPHTYKEGSDLYPHVHWIQSNTGGVCWQLEYKWFNNGVTIPAAFTTVDSGAKAAFTYVPESPPQSMSQIGVFDPLDGTGMKVSSMLIMKLSRIPADPTDTYSGDALMYEFDLHYQSDGHGSQLEYNKLD